MAKRASPNEPIVQPKVFDSQEEIDSGIEKLRCRVADVEKLRESQARVGGQAVAKAEFKIQETIRDVFGPRSPEFSRYGEHKIWRTTYTPDVPGHNYYPEVDEQASLEAGIPETITMIQGRISDLEDRKGDLQSGATLRPAKGVPAAMSKKVFVVHGRDEATRQTVARLLERLGLEAIILHEQPSQGRTVIEKFERYSDVGYAVVLLTADDKGGPKGESPKGYKPRARQNVILELGFFLGKLGRNRVCPLHEENVELPSDYEGVVYVPRDAGGAWQTQLAKEMKSAGLDVDLNELP